MSWRLARFSVPLFLLLAILLTVSPGCGGNKADDVTAANSQYAPAGADDATEGAGSSTTSAPETASHANEPPANVAADPHGTSRGPRHEKAAAADENGFFEIPDQQARPRPKVSYEVPDGDAGVLMAHIAQLDEAFNILASEATSLDAIKPEATKNLDAQEQAAEKILTLKPTEEERVDAISAKARALQAKLQLGVPDAEEKLTALMQQTADDKNESLRQMGVIFRLFVPLHKLKSGEIKDPAPVMAALEKYLTEIQPDRGTFGFAVQAVRAFQGMNRPDEMIVAMRAVGKRFQDSPNQEVAMNALGLTQQAGMYLEMEGRIGEAKEVFDSLQEAVSKLDNEQIKKQVEESIVNAQKRTSLPGQVLAVENLVDAAGAPIDWATYKGKVVLLDFWATWCKPCIAEIPNMREVYAAYKDKGFEIIGVNLDDDIADLHAFLEKEKLEWTVAVPANPEERGVGSPLAVQCGVDSIPFMLLIDQTGKVAAIHTRGPRLELELRKLLNITDENAPASETPATETPATETPATETPATETPKTETPATETPATETPKTEEAPAEGEKPEGDAASASPAAESELDLPLEPANEAAPDEGAAPASDESSYLAPVGDEYFVAFADEKQNETAAPAEAAGENEASPARNPYLADAGLSTLELVEFVQDMQDKPTTIQRRPGFAEAVADAADRILADAAAKEKHRVLAALAKFDFLHQRASLGDEPTDAALAAFVEKMKDEPNPKIAREVELLHLERQALDAEKLEPAQVEKLLADLKAYCEAHRQEMTDKHLRLASATVGAINRLADGDAREKHFQEFGSLFAASASKELARYGKRLAKEAPQSSLVGSSLELDGLTELGAQFDWQAYRGKVVVVDFWATWCGPCRRAAPAVKAFYEAHREHSFDVVGVNLDKDADALTQYLDEQKIPWPNIVAEDGARLAEKYSVRGIPTFMLIDREGKVLEVGNSFEDLQPKIEKLLTAS